MVWDTLHQGMCMRNQTGSTPQMGWDTLHQVMGVHSHAVPIVQRGQDGPDVSCASPEFIEVNMPLLGTTPKSTTTVVRTTSFDSMHAHFIYTPDRFRCIWLEMFSDRFTWMQQSLVARQNSISVFNLVQESGRLLRCLNGTGTSGYSPPTAWTYRDTLAQWERCPNVCRAMLHRPLRRTEPCCSNHIDTSRYTKAWMCKPLCPICIHQDPSPPCTEE